MGTDCQELCLFPEKSKVVVSNFFFLPCFQACLTKYTQMLQLLGWEKWEIEILPTKWAPCLGIKGENLLSNQMLDGRIGFGAIVVSHWRSNVYLNNYLLSQPEYPVHQNLIPNQSTQFSHPIDVYIWHKTPKRKSPTASPIHIPQTEKQKRDLSSS